MTMAIQRAGNVDVCCGLMWHPLQNPEQIDSMLEARQLAEERSARHLVIVGPQRPVPMVGLWTETRAPARGLLSAAALAAHGGEGHRIVLAALPDGNYWLSKSTSSAQLDPDLADVVGPPKLIGNRIDAAATRLSSSGNKLVVMAIGDVSAIDSPWARNATPIAWADLVRAVADPSIARLNGLERDTPQAVKIIGGAVLLGIAYFGWGHYDAWRKEKDEAARRAIPDADAQRLRAARIQDVVTQALTIDTASADPYAFIEACWKAAQPFGWRYHGWIVGKIVCDPAAGLTVQLAPDYGAFETPTPDGLSKAVSRFGARVEFGTDLQTASVQYALPTTVVRPALERTALPTFDQHARGIGSAIADLRSANSKTAVTIGAPIPKPLRFLDPTQRDPRGADIETDVPAMDSYQTVTIDMTSDRLAQLLDPLQPFARTMRLDRIELAPAVDRVNTRLTLTHFLHP